MPTPNASSPPATSPTTNASTGATPSGSAGFGFGKGTESLFSPGSSGVAGNAGNNSLLRPPTNAASASSLAAHGPSPLATSPPVIAMDGDGDDDAPSTPSVSAPKIKLTLSKKS